MLYRDLPSGGEVSTLGLGCMRFPVLDTPEKPIDRVKAKELIRYCIDNGVNYLDTAYGYHGGNSEGMVGEALQDGYREKVTLTTKLPCWLVKETADMERLLDEQLARLRVDHVDFYLAHALDGKQFDRMVGLGLLEFMDDMVAKGKIRYPGFSFHDDAAAFRKIVDAYPWKLAQVQMNFLDEFYQATMEGVRYAASKGIKIVAMEPARGGSLIKTVPEEIKAIYEEAVPGRSVSEWVFRWVIDKPEFMTILSGMSNMEQVEDNLRIFSAAGAGCLSDAEKATYVKVRETYKSRLRVGCTGCEYCQPCPQGVKIPDIFRAYDHANMFDDKQHFMKKYNKLEVKADSCVACGVCVAACPQHFATPIPDMLKEIHDTFIEWGKK